MNIKHLTSFYLILSLILCSSLAFGSDHREGLPATGSSSDSRSDVNDVYVFVNSNRDSLVLIMSSLPDADAPDPAPFNPRTSYEFKIDTNRDNKADKTFSAQFNRSTDSGSSFFDVFSRETGGKKELIGSGRTGETILLQNGGKAMANIFDDPFFFDQEAYEQFRQTKDANSFDPSTATNSFAGENVAAIVMELPVNAVRPARSSSPLRIWARTVKNGRQFDRVGSPGLSMLLIPKSKKIAFAQGSPHQDRRFIPFITNSLRSLGNRLSDSRRLARMLVPNVLVFDPANPSGYPNGRKLQDDVMDSLLSSITFGLVTSDFVSNDSSFLDSFPYLNPPTTSNDGTPTGAHVAASSGNRRDIINISNKNSTRVDVAFGPGSLSSTMINLTLSSGTTTIQGGTIQASSGQGVASFSGLNASSLPDGPITIQVTGATVSGNTINFSGTAATKDTVAPPQPSSVIVPSSSANPQNIINSQTQTAVSFDITLPSTYLGTETLTLEGSDGSNTFSASATAPVGGGTVHVSGVNGGGLADGGVTLTITATDIAGNSSTRIGTAIKDIVPPAAPTAAHVAADLTSNQQDEITSISASNVKVLVSFSAQSLNSDSVSVTLSDGSNNTVTAGPVFAPIGLGDILISNINASGLGNGSIPIEIISFDFARNQTVYQGTPAIKH